MGSISALKMIKYNIASINCCTEIEGPYKRLTIWFQGCNIRCKGCCNPDYQALIPRHIITLDELLKIITDAKKQFDIEGVTYTGGEPTLQQNLPLLTAKIKEIGLGVISYTGRLYEEVSDLLKGCDLVIDGEFKQDNLDNSRKILGSTNQRIINLTDRYKTNLNWFLQDGKMVEINVSNMIFVNGDKI